MSWRAHGMRTWLLQRLTAIYMLFYLVGFVVVVLRAPSIDFTVWRSLFVSPAANICTGLFFFSILFHAWVGIRDILIDYVHASSIRYLLWILITLGLIALGLWVSMILYSVVVL
jgi:succinate dehydrogenase / fumarate reductase membrane anchor subunit